MKKPTKTSLDDLRRVFQDPRICKILTKGDATYTVRHLGKGTANEMIVVTGPA